MYSINTQLTCFRYSPDSRRMLVNIKWWKLEVLSDLNVQGISLNDFEIQEFKTFMTANKENFPGPFFIEPAGKGQDYLFVVNQAVTGGLPGCLILSENISLRDYADTVYKVMPVILTDENYNQDKVYGLSFDLVGQIQIYKQVKT